MCKRNTRYDMVPWVSIVIGVLGLFLGKADCEPEVKQSSFSCANRTPGYYADVSTGCQVYHMCDNVGRQFSYSCPNATLFQQRMLICDHWYMVNCSKATSYYDANLRIGQKDRRFVDDSEVNTFTRTPRPDLLTAPSTTLEYNTVYRHGESNLSPTKYVGVESNDENSTDEATYFPPNHWSTEISKQTTSSAENNDNRRLDLLTAQLNDEIYRSRQNEANKYQNQRVIGLNQSNDFQTTQFSDQNQNQYQNAQQNPQNQEVSYQNSQTNYQNQRLNGQNRRTNYQNPSDNDQNVETNQNQENYQNIQPLDPTQETYQNSRQINVQNQPANNQNKQQMNQNDQVSRQTEIQREDNNNQSPQLSDNRHLQADYRNRRNNTRHSSIRGKAINLSSRNSGNNQFVNFRSNFKATTPVYPRLVKDTTRTPNNIGLLPPRLSQQDDLLLELLPPKKPQQEPEQERFNEQQLFSKLWSTTPSYPTDDDYKEFEKNLHKPISVPVENNSDKSAFQGFLVNFASNFKATTPQYPTSVNPTSPEPSELGVVPPKQSNNVVVNFESRYKATTPNYPTFVEQTSQNPSDAGVLPPKDGINETKRPTDAFENERLIVFKSTFRATTPQYPSHVDSTSPNPFDVGLLAPRAKVVYKSNFKATTPKYPSFVEATSQNPSAVGLIAPKDTVVNFHSDFKATTPNYPRSVASTSPDPGQAGLLAPQALNNEATGLKPDQYITDANSFSENYNQYPFKTFEPTSEYIEEGDLQEIPGIRLSNFMKSFDYKQWQELRQAFKIPEYEFPLDDATRPSYNSVVNSFEPRTSRK